jgi:hypothetical protein
MKIRDLIAKCGGKPFISIRKNIEKLKVGSKACREMLIFYGRSREQYSK